MSRSGQAGVRSDRIRTGVEGLDDVLGGGLLAGRLNLLEGDPGTGKTTLALQFLLDGSRAGERVVFITLSETRIELTASAASHGWSLEDIEVRGAAAAPRRSRAPRPVGVPGQSARSAGGRSARTAQHPVNDQYRICFVWKDGDAEDVEIVDYH